MDLRVQRQGHRPVCLEVHFFFQKPVKLFRIFGYFLDRSVVSTTVGFIARYNLRNATYQTIRARTALHYNIFLPSVLQGWNELPTTLQNSPSLQCFNIQLKKNAHQRVSQVYHSRPRTECSSQFRGTIFVFSLMWTSRN